MKKNKVIKYYFSAILLFSFATLFLTFQNCAGNVSKRNYGSASLNSLSADRIQKVTMGNTYTCAVHRDKSVYCWGELSFFGIGIQNANSPVKIIDSSKNITDFSSGDFHSCYISNLKVYCFGSNYAGQLGTGNFNNISPQNVVAVNIPDAQRVFTTMDMTCAISNGDVYCWGDNFGAAVGIGKDVSELPFVGFDNTRNAPGNWYIPTPQKILSPVGRGFPIAMFSESNSTYGHCALLIDASVICWGYVNIPGTTFKNPTYASNLAGASEIQNGNLFGCGLYSGVLKCYGTNLFGNFGNNTINNSGVNISPNGMNFGVTVFGVGGNYACAYKDKIYCWGSNAYGQFSTGDMQDSLIPKAAIHPTGVVKQIAAGYYHNCFVISGEVYCNGKNDKGQLGTGDYVPQYNSAKKVIFPN